MVKTELEKFCIEDCEDFSPAAIFECGQAFRWNADENGIYTGIAYGVPARVWTENGKGYIIPRKEAFRLCGTIISI